MTESASGDAARRGGDAVKRLDEITRRLRRECPWDREQDARSIVPHTVEEAYELAEAAQRGEPDRILDELGDVLFQVHFLALLLEEQGQGDLAAVAEHCRQKLIRRHPHVFENAGAAEAEQASHHRGTPGSEAEDVPRSDSGAAEAEQASHHRGTPGSEADEVPRGDSALSSDDVLSNWDRIKREREGEDELFANVPENLPALLYARKLQRRAAERAEDGEGDRAELARFLREWADELAGLLDQGELAGAGADPAQRDRIEHALGALLFAAVDAARRMRADPELALRATAERFRELKDSAGP